MTATALNINLEAVKALIKEFEKTQRKYYKYGARDSEPDGVFQGILWKVVNDKDAEIPQTGDNWELYSHTMDCSEAAAALHAACLCVVQAIFACSHKDMREVRKYLKDYCWRYN